MKHIYRQAVMEEGGDLPAAEATVPPVEGEAPPAEPEAEAVPFYQSAPDDWREQIAGEDPARLNDLKRYTTFDKWMESGFEAKTKIRKGEVSTGLPEDASEEQLVEYRTANGIPESADKYTLTLEEGLELSEMDKGIMASVLEVAHVANIPDASMSALTSAWQQAKNAELQRIVDQDGIDKQSTEQQLRKEWGADYLPTFNSIGALLGRLPDEVKEDIMGGRDGNGRALMSNPAYVKFLGDIALSLNPMANVPGGNDNPSGTARDIVNKAQKLYMEGDMDAYNAMEKEYLASIDYLKSIGEKI